MSKHIPLPSPFLSKWEECQRERTRTSTYHIEMADTCDKSVCKTKYVLLAFLSTYDTSILRFWQSCKIAENLYLGLFSSAGCLAAFICIPFYCVFFLQHSPSLRFRHINLSIGTTLDHGRCLWSRECSFMFFISNEKNVTTFTVLSAWSYDSARISASPFQSTYATSLEDFKLPGPEAVVQNDFTASGPMEVDSAITYSTLPGSIGFMIDAHSNSHYCHPASVPPPVMQAHLGPTIIPSAKRLFNLRTLKVFSNGARPDYCAACR